MRAKDVMTAPAVTVEPDAKVEDVAKLLLRRGISAVPVTEPDGRLRGIVSEGDLVRRVESGTERTPSWWLRVFGEDDDLARDYAKSRGRRVTDVMTREVVTVAEDATLPEIATLLERHRIKRVPVMRDGKVTGIVSRANLLQGLASQPGGAPPAPAGDEALRKRIKDELRGAGVDTIFVNVVVGEGGVHLWGAVRSIEQREAARVAAETVAGKMPVTSHLSVPSSGTWAMMWAE
jgi:CBS domain-containing protein